MKTLNATTCPDSCCSNYPESMTFDNCTEDATDPIVPKAPRTLPDDLDSIALIDEAATPRRRGSSCKAVLSCDFSGYGVCHGAADAHEIKNRGQKVLGKPRAAMLVSLLPKGDGRLAQG